MTAVHTVIDSPVGELTLVASRPGVLSGVYFPGHARRPELDSFGTRDDAAFAEAAGQLAEYFDGSRTDFELPLAPRANDLPTQGLGVAGADPVRADQDLRPARRRAG